MATQKALAQKIARKTGISEEQVSKVLSALGSGVADVLKEDVSINPTLFIPSLGRFILHRDNRTRNGYRVEFKASMHFKDLFTNFQKVA